MQKIAYAREGHEVALTAKANDETLTELFNMVGEAYGIAPVSVPYLLAYGFKQSVQDATAQPAAEAKQEGDTVDEEGNVTETVADKVKAAVAGALDKRLAAIVAGTVRVREAGAGVTRDPRAVMIRQVALQWLRAVAAKAGKKLPKAKEDLATMLAKFVEANKAKIEAEADKRLAEVPDVTLD